MGDEITEEIQGVAALYIMVTERELIFILNG
jgi:hypothetical protein